MKRAFSFIHRHQLLIFRSWFYFWIVWLFFRLYKSLSCYQPSYTNFNISDWMINYQGGFVRRGLAGEVLYQLHQCLPYPLHDTILAIMFLTFVIIMVLLVRLFMKEGWSPLLLISPLLLAPAFCYPNPWTRRDYISLLLTWLIFMSYFRYIRYKDIKVLVGMEFCSVLTLLLHEAAFFYTIPILFIHYWGVVYLKSSKWINSFFKSLLLFMPAFVTMFLVSYFKGDKEVANTIWNSWQPIMHAFPLDDDCVTIGKGVQALTWETVETLRSHFKMNFGGEFFLFIPAWPFAIYNLLAIYYLVTRMNTVDLKWNILKKIDRVQLSNVLLYQFIFMLPMLLFLSCDGARVIPYWVLSVLVFFHYNKENDFMFSEYVTHISIKLQNQIDRVRFLSNPWVYFFILFTIPIASAGSPKLLASSPFAMLYDLWLFVKPYIL